MAGAVVFGLNAISFLISLVVTLTVRGRFDEERAADAPSRSTRDCSRARRTCSASRCFAGWPSHGSSSSSGWAWGWWPTHRSPSPSGRRSWGFGLLIACWGTGSVLGTVFGRWMNARTEPLWMVFGAAGVAVSAFGVGLFGLFPLVLVSLLVMGTSDGVSIVAENGIMQRRTPDAVRSRTMAALEAVLSLGLAIAYLAAGPILRLVEAQTVYVIAGVFAVGATVVLLPLVRLRADASDGRPTGPGTPVGQPTTGDRCDCVILALDDGGHGARSGTSGRCGAGDLPDRQPGRLRGARLHRLPLDRRIGCLALADLAAHDGCAGARAADRELVRGSLRSPPGPRRVGPARGRRIRRPRVRSDAGPARRDRVPHRDPGGSGVGGRRRCRPESHRRRPPGVGQRPGDDRQEPGELRRAAARDRDRRRARSRDAPALQTGCTPPVPSCSASTPCRSSSPPG